LELLLLACGTISTQSQLALGCASLTVARLGLPGLTKQPVPSLLLRAFGLARDAIHGIA